MLVRVYLFLLLGFNFSSYAGYVNPSSIDIGDGTDGVCNFTPVDSPLSGTYNCTSLTISGGTVASTGATPLIIKVQGDVSITGVLSVSGGNGTDGSNVDNLKAGGLAGPGGFAGADYPNPGPDGNDGLGVGGGFGGTGAGAVIGPVGGGGGGGGSYADTSLPGDGLDGLTDTIANGVGGAGSNTSYGNQNSFETTFLGGSGGGAGGSGDNNAATIYSGAGGGGGGGALKISAGGDIDISGSVVANGGNGGNAASYDGGTGGGGSGGGGSGGAIFIQSRGDITISGAATAIGGNGGEMGVGGSTNGDGGDGGDGRIRFDDQDGVIIGAINPTAITNNTYQASTVPTFESSISCGTIEDVNDSAQDFFTLLLGFMVISITGFATRYFFHLKDSAYAKQ